MWVKDHYQISGEDIAVAWYYVFNDGSAEYTVSSFYSDKLPKELIEAGLTKDIRQKKEIPYFKKILTEENRVPGKKKPVYKVGSMTIERIPEETDERFMVYRVDAKEGEPAYSPKKHDAPHYEGPKTPEGMREWATWYSFEKMDDGTYRASLDESWWWGGGHNDGGTIHTPIPEEWHELPYEEFLENVVTLSAASHYGFDAEELLEKEGLKEFFGY